MLANKHMILHLTSIVPDNLADISPKIMILLMALNMKSLKHVISLLLYSEKLIYNYQKYEKLVYFYISLSIFFIIEYSDL